MTRYPPVFGMLALMAAACSPTVRLEVPDKPIRIDMNIRIDQEIRIKVDRALDAAIAAKPGIF